MLLGRSSPLVSLDSSQTSEDQFGLPGSSAEMTSQMQVGQVSSVYSSFMVLLVWEGPIRKRWTGKAASARKA